MKRPCGSDPWPFTCGVITLAFSVWELWPSVCFAPIRVECYLAAIDGNLGYEFGMVQPCTIGIESYETNNDYNIESYILPR